MPKVFISVTLVVDGRRYGRTIGHQVLRSVTPQGWPPVLVARLADLVREAGLS